MSLQQSPWRHLSISVTVYLNSNAFFLEFRQSWIKGTVETIPLSPSQLFLIHDYRGQQPHVCAEPFTTIAQTAISSEGLHQILLKVVHFQRMWKQVWGMIVTCEMLWLFKDLHMTFSTSNIIIQNKYKYVSVEKNIKVFPAFSCYNKRAYWVWINVHSEVEVLTKICSYSCVCWTENSINESLTYVSGCCTWDVLGCKTFTHEPS